MFKHLNTEIKQIKWTKPKDVVKQTAYVLGITIIAALIFASFDTGVQALIKLLF